MEAVLVEFVIKWNGKELPIAIEEGASVADLKQKLQGLTNVLISKQKLLGLKDKGKPATDEVLLNSKQFPLRFDLIFCSPKWLT